jgi:hypothetical protein
LGIEEYRVASAVKVSSVAAPTRLTDPLDQVDYRLAETIDEKEAIYSLRYRAYLREGAIRPSADERVTDRFDDLPNSWVFGVYFHGELHSSIRITVLTPENRVSPSLDVFGDILHPMLDQGLVFIDSTRFVGDPAKARNFPELPYVTRPRAFISMPIMGWLRFVPNTRRFTAVCFYRRPCASRACTRVL